jgi:peptide/nickel transport system substrate-binding protein
LKTIPYDLAKARVLLEEAGWKDTDNDGVRDKMVNGTKVKMEFSIQLNSGNNQRKQMAILFSEALKQIGVTAQLSTLEWAVFLDNMDKHEFDAVIGGWAMEVTEGDMYQIWHAKSSELGGSNYISYNNPRVNELIEAIRGEFDYENRRGMYQEIQQLIHEEQPYNFLISEKRVAGYNRRFRNAVFFPPRPCYNLGWWWVPRDEQKYGTPSNAVAAVE